RLDGSVDRAKYPYNSGQMIEAAALLYKITNEPRYLEEAQQVAKASFHHFFETDGSHRLKNSDNWFIAVMMRGFIQLYKLDNNPTYLQALRKNLDFAWMANRDRSEEHTSELQSRENLVCRLLLEKKKKK